jgi:hypothetical protein
MRTKMLMMLTLSVLLIAASASAQRAVSMSAKVPFAFTVAGKVLPAGDYKFSQSPGAAAITVRSADGKESAIALILTRMAAGIHTTAQDSHVVFDKVGNSYFLSEIWVPGMDGYVLNVTKEMHEHAIFDASE